MPWVSTWEVYDRFKYPIASSMVAEATSSPSFLALRYAMTCQTDTERSLSPASGVYRHPPRALDPFLMR